MNMGNFLTIGGFSLNWILIPLGAMAICAVAFRIVSARRLKGPRESNDTQLPDGSSRHHEILRLAMEKKGTLTVTDVVLKTGLSIQEAEKILNEMVDGLRVSMEVKESGVITYEFAEIAEKK